jgi:hypothetical protein
MRSCIKRICALRRLPKLGGHCDSSTAGQAGARRGLLVMNVSNLVGEISPNMVAAVAAAAVTLCAALINLRIAWRREVLDRLQTKSSPKSRRGLLIAISILVLAAGVGGYAAALYTMQRDRQHTEALRADLRQQIAQLSDTALRFEQTRAGERSAIEADARVLEARRRGTEGVFAAARIPPCRLPMLSGDAAEPRICSEADAAPVAVCAIVPAAAQVYEVQGFARSAIEGGAASEQKVDLGSSFGRARLAALPVEHDDATASRRVCVDVRSWDGEHALDVRLRVRYLAEPAAAELPPSTPAPRVTTTASG